MLPSDNVNSLAQVESSVKRCISRINQFRQENERLRKVSREVQNELLTVQHKDSHFAENKNYIIHKLESLLTQIDSLHIENITND